MSFWSGETLIRRAKSECLISPFDPNLIDCAAYTLTLGGHAFTSGDDDHRDAELKRRKTPGIVKVEKENPVTIQPGQFAFLLTEESVTIPTDAVGFISIKATHKFAGLINVSGFHVDPGWSSPLIFGVFNAGPKELVFERGEKLFLIFYADLDMLSSKTKDPLATKFDHIPSSFIQKMAGEVPSLYKLKRTTDSLGRELRDVSRDAKLATGVAGLALVITLAMMTKGLFFNSPTNSTVTIQARPAAVAATQNDNVAKEGSKPMIAESDPIVISPTAGNRVDAVSPSAGSTPQ